MKILNSINEKIRLHLYDYIEKANPISRMGTTSPEGGVQAYPYDYGSHMQVYLVNVYCFAAIRAIARDVSAVPLKAQNRETIDGEVTWVDAEGGELFDLLSRPNPDETPIQLTERMVISLETAGNGYWLFDGVDEEFYYVQPDWVTIVLDKAGRPVKYKIENQGIQYDADIDTLIHWKLSNIKGDYYGMPPSQVIRDTIVTKLNLNNYIKGFFKNNALAGTVFSTDQMLSKERKDATRKELNRLLSGSDNAFRTAILDQGQKLDKLSHNLKDLIPQELDKMIMQEVLAAYGVPPGKIGIFGEMTYANADKMDKIYSRDTVRPMGLLFESIFNLQFVTPRYGDDVRVKWDETLLPGLQDDENEKGKRNVNYVRGGIITPNEARAEIGYEPIDGGDELRAGGGMPAFGMENIGDEEPPDDESLEDKAWVIHYDIKTGKVKKTKKEIDIDEEDARIWLEHDKKLSIVENSFEKLIKKYWNGQVKRVIENLQNLTLPNGKFVRTKMYIILRKGAVDDSIAIFNLKKENKELIKILKPFIKATALKHGQNAIDDLGASKSFSLKLGASTSFSLKDENIRDMIAGMLKRSERMTDKTFKDILRILENVYEDGGGINQAQRMIREKYKQYSRSRAITIARSEMNTIVSGAKWAGGIQGGATHKVWYATIDSRVRPDHAAAHLQEVEILDTFDVGGDNLMYPGDLNGFPGNVINCRCAHNNIIKDDED